MNMNTLKSMIAVLVALTITGCYWTQPEPSGSLGVSIEAPDVSSSSEIGASATLEEIDGVVAIFLFSESVMVQGESSFNEISSELSDSFETSFYDADLDPTKELEQTTFTAEADGAQALWTLFDSSQGTSGSSRFTGLEVGEEYFLLTFGGGIASDADYVGFDTATVGSTEQVTLRLDSDFNSFYSFLVDNYDFPPETESVSVTYGRAEDATPFILPSELFYDVIDASIATIDISQYKTDFDSSPDFYVSDTSGSPPAVSLAQRLTEMDYLSTDGSSVDGSSGSRLQLPSSDSVIGELEYGQEVQLVITDTAARGVTNTAEFPSQVIGITEPFTVGVDANNADVKLYQWTAVVGG